MTIFHYIEGGSFWHSHPAWCKLVETFVLVTAIYYAKFGALVLFILFLLASLAVCGLFPVKVLSELRLFSGLLFLIFISAFFSSVEEAVILRGLAALIETVRFGAYILGGMIFTRTTSPGGLYSAIYRILRPLPFVPHRRIASFFKIVFSLIPIAFDTFEDVGDTLAARGNGRVKNPVQKIKNHVYPLMRDLFIKTDRFAEALVSRSYDGTNSYEIGTTSIKAIVHLLFVVLVIGGVLFGEMFILYFLGE